MNRLYYLLLAVLSLIIIFLSKGIFFGENSYNKRAELIEDNKIQLLNLKLKMPETQMIILKTSQGKN